MSEGLKKAVDALFAPEDSRIGDIKFFRGTSSEVRAEQLLAQFQDADLQVRDQRATRMHNIDGDLTD